MATVASLHTPGHVIHPRVSAMRPTVHFAASPAATCTPKHSSHTDPSQLLNHFDFCDGFPKSLACSICCDPFNQPVETPRGQVFCKPCIQIWLENNKVCPLDQAPLSVSELRPINRVLSGLIDELPVQCKGCKTQMKRGHISHHMASECNVYANSANAGIDENTNANNAPADGAIRVPLSPLAWNTPLPQRSSLNAKFGTPAGLPGWDSPEAPDSLVKGKGAGGKPAFDSPLATNTATAAGASPINLNTRNDLHQGVKYTIVEGSFTKLPDFAKLAAAAGANTKAAGIRTGVSGSVSLAELAAVGELDVNSGGAAVDATDSGDSNGKLSASTKGKKAAGSSSSSSASSSGTLLDFAVKYEAIIQVPVSGVYTFYVGSNDGSKLVIDGSPIVDNDGVHYYGEKEGAVELSAGRHHFELSYFHKNGKVLEMGVRAAHTLECFYSLLGEGWMNIGGFAKRPMSSELLYTDKVRETPAAIEAARQAVIANNKVTAQLQADCHHLKASLAAAGSRNELAEIKYNQLKLAFAEATGKALALEAEIRGSQITLAQANREKHVACAEQEQASAAIMLKDEEIRQLEVEKEAAIAGKEALLQQATDKATASVAQKEAELQAAKEAAVAAIGLKEQGDVTTAEFRQMAEDNAAELARKEDQRKAEAELAAAAMLLKENELKVMAELSFYHVALAIKLQVHSDASNSINITLCNSDLYEMAQGSSIPMHSWAGFVRTTLNEHDKHRLQQNNTPLENAPQHHIN